MFIKMIRCSNSVKEISKHESMKGIPLNPSCHKDSFLITILIHLMCGRYFRVYYMLCSYL